MSWRTGEVVTGPDGRAWLVRRRWVPRLGTETLWGRFRRRSRRVRRRAGEVGSDDPGGWVGDLLSELLGDLAVVLLVIAAAVLLVFVVVPLLVALVDMLILLVLAALATVVRVAFGRPWIVEASDAQPPIQLVLRWKVVGWRASADHCHAVAQSLAAGITPPGAEALRGVRRS